MLLDRANAKSAIWAAAIEGERVLILGESVRAATHIQREILDILPKGFLAEVQLATGKQSIAFPGAGAIHFLSVRSSLRGCAFDQVFAPADTRVEVHDHIEIMLATSQIGQLTVYTPEPSSAG